MSRAADSWRPERGHRGELARKVKAENPELDAAEIARRVGMSHGGAWNAISGKKYNTGKRNPPAKVRAEVERLPALRAVDRYKHHLRIVPADFPPRQLPATRAECEPGGAQHIRPCPFLSCRHHTAVDVSGAGMVRVFDVADGLPSCSLDVAEDGHHTLQEVADMMGVTRERVRQIEFAAMRKVRHRQEEDHRQLAEFAEGMEGR